ncbi:MAG: hypothetical protein LAP87_20485 [Acidobacteriia bacterium]|nr:hypothetical protein [Terriglobia bacterium]
MESNSARPMATGLTILGGLARLVQNLNFAPVGALSLFAGARLRGWRAYLLPIALMAVTDPIVSRLYGYSAWAGYSFATPFIYASFLINVWIGSRLRRTENPGWIAAAALAGSVQFFVLSNFGTWLAPHSSYGHSLGGLVNCYIAAVPFFRNTVLSDLLYAGVFFGLHAVLSRVAVRSERVAQAA